MTMRSALFIFVPFTRLASTLILVLLLVLGACSDDGAAGTEIEIADTQTAGGTAGDADGVDGTDADAGTTDDTSVEPECSTSLDCVIKNPGLGACQSPICNFDTFQCEIHAKDSCCETSGDCPIDDICLQGICPSPGAACEFVAVEAECKSNDECPVENSCQTSLCSDACGGICEYQTIEDCCVNADDCTINDPCLSSSCENSECVFTPVSACCNSDAGCNDGNECTVDTCVENACLYENVAGCGAECSDTKPCDDGNPCTTDECVNGECKIGSVPSCCTKDSQCPSVNSCASGYCDMATHTCTILVSANDPACCDPVIGNQCDDGNQCTADFCIEYTCTNPAIPGCTGPECQVAADCKSDSPCVEGLCVEGACSYQTVEGCCEKNNECNDKNPCTQDSCFNNDCKHETLSPCCLTDAECVDSNAECTQGVCGEDNLCKQGPIAGCCFDDAQCDDKNTCTSDTCQNWKCVYEPLGNCCIKDSDCDDKLLCTSNICDNGNCLTAEIDDCCEEDIDCSDGNPCTFDLCFANQCLVSPPGEDCCTSNDQCDDGDPCTNDSCNADNSCEHSSVAGCCDVSVGDSLGKVDFLPGEIDGIAFAPSQGQYRWREHDSNAFDGEAAMYYGNNDGTHYCYSNFFGASPGTATIPVESDPFPSGVFDLPNTGTVSVFFHVRLDMRKEADVDKLQLDVLEGGQVIGTVWTKADVPATSYGEWVPAQVDLTPYGGKKVQLRFQFSVETASAYGGCYDSGTGPRIDLFEVISSKCQAPPECTANGDCTASPGICYEAKGSCNDGKCEYKKLADCCETTSECNDGNACTFDICAAGKCNHQPIPGCCLADADCSATVACLQGVCNPVSHVCEFKVQGSCCTSDAQCNTPDKFCPGESFCTEGVCTQVASDKTETLMSFVFTSGYDGWQPEPQSGQYRWRENDETFVSSPRSLYFGNNDGEHYCSPFSSSPSNGIAHLPGLPSSAFPTGAISFDATGKSTLSFSVYLDVRSNPDVDKLAVRLDDVNGTQNTVWSKEMVSADQYGSWVNVSMDVSKFAPFTGTVRFFFNVVNTGTDGGCYNAGAGVFVDDVKVVQSCKLTFLP
ncbi:MAG TPA: hypothetical protein EYN66_04640 [Myxococcales bacterium]|nr:hypothetical protein [Myxococcales bacterium]